MSYLASILIVDDDAGVRGAIEAALTGGAYRLSFAVDGVDAIAKAKEATPDVILLDIMMPGMDGFDVCRHLRADPMLAHVPIIMVTALDDRLSLLKALQAGADEFIAKPFERVELRARVQTAARLNRSQQLVAERAKFEWVVERANDGYLIIGDEGQVVYANSQSRLYLGLDTNDALSAAGTFLVLARGHYQLEPVHAWSKWALVPAAELEHPLYLVQAATATSAAFWLEVDVLDVPGQSMAGRLVCLRDVSDQINTMRQRWALDLAMANMWHAPLSNILSSLELLAARTGELSPAQATGGVNIALQAVRRLDTEIQQVLEYVSCSSVARPFTTFALMAVPQLAAAVGNRLKLRPIAMRINKNLAQGLLPLSRQMLELILVDLLQNAQRLHPTHDPTIEIQATLEAPGQVMMRFTDDGVHLSPSELVHFWQSGYSSGTSSAFPLSGKGLSLPMVATLVWECGGMIVVRNRQDRSGLSIEMTLPLVKAQR